MKRKSVNKRIKIRAFHMLVVTMFTMGLLVLGYGYRQIINYSFYESYLKDLSVKDYYINSPRGTIEDRNGRPLAQSVIAYSLFVDPNLLRIELEKEKMTYEQIADILVPHLKEPKEEIIKKLKAENTSFIWLRRLIDRDEYLQIKKQLLAHKIHAVTFEEEYKRYYPNGSMLAQVLGFVGTDNSGLSGMEARLEEYIKANETKVKLTYDSMGHVILQSVLTDRVPKEQDTATLTIDTTVQFIAEEALAKQIAESHADSGSVIVMDSHTGDILAMVNQPSFEPANFDKYPKENWKNIAVTNNYEPGSTFKPIIAAAALASGKWHINEVYHDPGYIDIDDRTIINWDGEKNGDVTLLEILKASINTGMVYIGMQTGADTLLDYIHNFGFGKATAIELPGEGEGILYQKETILPVNTATMSIGQGISVTPLQMVQAFSVFANNGKMVQPHIIKKITAPDGRIVAETKTKVVSTPVSVEVVNDINSILEQEVNSGGGIKAHLDGYQFCGKTGTAQVPDNVHGGYFEDRHVASFIGYGPLPDPRFVILIVVNNPGGLYYGAQVAAPVFKDIVSQLVRYYQISPTVVSSGDDVKKIKRTVDYNIRHTPEGQVIVPNFVEWSMGEVREWLTKAKLKFRPTGSGFAINQDYQPGMTVDEGTAITVTFRHKDEEEPEVKPKDGNTTDQKD